MESGSAHRRSGPAIGYVWALRRFPAARWRIACFAGAIAAAARRHGHADRDDRAPLPALGPPCPERRARGMGAAALRPRDPARARGRRAERAAAARARCSGSSTTASGTCRGSTTPRSGTRTRSCTSSTRSTSPQACCSGGRSCTRGSRRARKPPTSSRRSLLASPIGLVLALVPEPLYDFYVEGRALGPRPARSTSRSRVSRCR